MIVRHEYNRNPHNTQSGRLEARLEPPQVLEASSQHGYQRRRLKSTSIRSQFHPTCHRCNGTKDLTQNESRDDQFNTAFARFCP